MPVEQRLSTGIADDLRRAVRIACHGKILGFDLSSREFAREQFRARFLRGEARREARTSRGPGTAVGEFLRREDPGDLACACFR